MHRSVRPYILAMCALPTCVGAQESGFKVYGREDGVVMPVLVKSVAADYTAEAFKAGIEGWNMLEAIVLPDGTIGDATVVCSLDPIHGLDQATVQAARKWTFEPGMKDGIPVAVRVTIKNAFTQGGKKPRMRAPTPVGSFPCND